MLTEDENPGCGILYIDDEEKALKYFRMAFSKSFKVHTALSGPEGLDLLRRESKRIGIVISDQRMPEMIGAEVLAIVRAEFPQVVRILTTAYSDLDSAIQAVNKGHIYQYVVKPWEIQDLRMVLQRAADYYHVLSERDELLSLKMTTLQRIICSDRLKWLLLSTRDWTEPQRMAFARALLAFVRALPDTPDRVRKRAEGFSPQQFEITALIRNEYRNAERCLKSIDGFWENATNGDSVDGLGEPAATTIRDFASAAAGDDERRLASQLSAFLAGLRATYDLEPSDIELHIEHDAEPRIRIGLSSAKRPIDPTDFATTLFGLLLDKETAELSILLFQALVALRSGSLSISASNAAAPDSSSSFEFRLPSSEAALPDETINCLYEKFASWDIARL